MDAAQHRRAAKEFVKRWQAMPCVEEEHSRSFWIELAHDVLGVPDPTRVLEFERKVKGRKIDVFYEDMGVLVEQKGRGISLDKASERSKKAGEETPFQQAKWYADNLPGSVRPRWVVTCNFDEFRIYDLHRSDFEDYVSFTLEELPDQYHLLAFFTDEAVMRVEREEDVSVKAGERVGRLYNALAARYHHIDDDPHEQRSLNILMVRLIFLLYAEDSGIFNKDALLHYLQPLKVEQMRAALVELFDVLDTPDGRNSTQNLRSDYLDTELAAFPYVNGGLFGGEDIVVPQFDNDIRLTLLSYASSGFDWSKISPTIFGAVFESTLNPETRREGGMHYTSPANIHKLIDPLFLDALEKELAGIEGIASDKKRARELHAFQDKLASVRILDPACGSGNFLTESYLSLRRLENRVLDDLRGEQVMLALGGDANPIKVSIGQFFGIEINDFAVSVAKTALWIAEEQMMGETEEIVQRGGNDMCKLDFLPLTTNDNIHCANALALDWNEVLPAARCSYIVGNPPFLGARNQSKAQKAELAEVFAGAKNCGNIDYVAGWYMKAARYMQAHPAVRAAFVSTNSICQGEQVANVWKPLADAGVRIDFAHDTFRWASEASDTAHVFVVVVGFSLRAPGGGEDGGAGAAATGSAGVVATDTGGLDAAMPGADAGAYGEEGCGGMDGGWRLRLFHHAGPDASAAELHPVHINAYLKDAPDVFIYGRSTPLCAVPEMGIGSQPIDGGNYIFTDDEREEFLQAEPAARAFMHPFLGSNEFINGKRRWILWLGDASPAQLKDMPLCMERVRAVREFRLASKRKQTKEAAERPTHFGTEIIAEDMSIVVPEVSSERRHYIPLGFVEPETVCSNLVRLVANAGLYHFGILHSQMHNAWMRMVCGRLKSDYRYSAGVVYNNFPWPHATRETLATPVEELVAPQVRARVEACAQEVLDARASYIDEARAAGATCTLADMYDPDNDFLYPRLVSAHRALDAAVEEAYGVGFSGDEEAIVAHLFASYAALTA